MDQLDLEYLIEQTKVIRPQSLRPSTNREAQLLFSVLFEDMDTIGLAHIQEGTIFCKQLTPVDPPFALEGFGPQAEVMFEKLRDRIKFYSADIGIGSTPGDHHEIHEPLAAAQGRLELYPLNQSRLIIQTVADGWEVALLWAVLRNIQIKS